MATGVTALVLALAINAGFRQTYEEQLLGATAHVNLSRKDAGGIQDYDALARRLRRLEGVTSVSPGLYETVLITSRGIVLKGIRLEDSPEQEKLFTRWREGGADLKQPKEGAAPPLLIGHKLAQELGVFAGDLVMVTSPQGHLTPFGLAPRYRSFRIAGVFESGFWDFDAGWAFTRLDVMQSLLSLEDRVSLLEMRLEDIYAAEEISQTAEHLAGRDFVSTPWMEMHQSLFRVLRLEKLVTGLFIGLIVMVAGLNILILLVMLVLEKRREIGAGEAPRDCRAALAGRAHRAGAAHLHPARRFHRRPGYAAGFDPRLCGGHPRRSLPALPARPADLRHRLRPFQPPPQIYGIAYVPFNPHALDGVVIIAAALLISLAATLYPARRATHVLPVEVLRYE